MTSRFVLSGVAALALVSTLGAQDVRQQGNAVAKLAWPAYTERQSWGRSASLSISNWAGFLAYAKTKGEGPDQVGRFFFERYKAGWGPANSGVAVRVARAMLFNYASFPNSDAQLVSANDTMAVVRARRAAYASAFGPTGVLNGTTLAEYERTFTVFGQLISEYLGVRYAERIDGDWVEWTFTGRGSAALTAFPRGGTFRATVTGEQVGNPQGGGTFEIGFLTDGTFEFRDSTGTVKVRERYDVALDQVALHDGVGENACPGQPVGTYRFTPQPNGDVVLGVLTDPCDARARYLARRWVKQ